MDKRELFQEISDNVVEMEDEIVEELCEKSLEEGIDPNETITEGLIHGMNRVSELYETGEYFLPEVLTASYAMNVGIDVLKEHITQEESEETVKIVIGVVEGDTHDIGKNLVKIMLEVGGFDVVDLGRDVPVAKFVDYVKENEVDIVGISSLMTTTMPGMEAVIAKLNEEGIRDKVKVMVGGAPVSPAFADKIGADGYSRNAIEAVEVAKKLVGAN